MFVLVSLDLFNDGAGARPTLGSPTFLLLCSLNRREGGFPGSGACTSCNNQDLLHLQSNRARPSGPPNPVPLSCLAPIFLPSSSRVSTSTIRLGFFQPRQCQSERPNKSQETRHPLSQGRLVSAGPICVAVQLHFFQFSFFLSFPPTTPRFRIIPSRQPAALAPCLDLIAVP